jgi:hypothetical protein
LLKIELISAIWRVGKELREDVNLETERKLGRYVLVKVVDRPLQREVAQIHRTGWEAFGPRRRGQVLNPDVRDWAEMEAWATQQVGKVNHTANRTGDRKMGTFHGRLHGWAWITREIAEPLSLIRKQASRSPPWFRAGVKLTIGLRRSSLKGKTTTEIDVPFIPGRDSRISRPKSLAHSLNVRKNTFFLQSLG